MKCYINTNGVTTRACQKSQQYAPKGQKLIAQGNTLGKSIANHYAPCKGKSVNYQCFCPCRAFCYFQSVHPRRCLGLCAFGAFSPFCLTFDTPSSFYICQILFRSEPVVHFLRSHFVYQCTTIHNGSVVDIVL